MLKIGILGHRFIEWGGGIDFLRMICSSLAHADRPVEMHVLIPTRGPRLIIRRLNLRTRSIIKKILGRDVAVSHAPEINDLARLFADSGASVQLHEIDWGEAAIERAARRQRLDVLLPAFDPRPFESNIPWVGYIYDAQHKYLPHFFSPAEIAQRDRDFTTMLKKAKVVIVNAKAVASDIETFFPGLSSSVVSLPPNAAPSNTWFDLKPSYAKAKYAINGPYFIICNQFWKHKDHRTAFEAFAMISDSIPELILVCTGAKSDHRDPQYFDGLLKFIREHGIESRVKILGLIPKTDQIALIRGALALIQPTMFEGGPGGGAGCDAIALGVPCIASDIPINRELDATDVRFFQSKNAESLKDALLATYAESNDRIPPAKQELLARGRMRLRLCGNTIVQAALIAIAAKPLSPLE